MSSFDAEGDESGEEERNETNHILKTRMNYIDRQAIRLVTYELHGLTILVVTVFIIIIIIIIIHRWYLVSRQEPLLLIPSMAEAG